MNLYQLHSNHESLHLHDEAHDKVPEFAWEKYKYNPEELKKRELIWAKDAKYAFKYAYVLNGPFKEGEATFAKDTFYATKYAELINK